MNPSEQVEPPAASQAEEPAAPPAEPISYEQFGATYIRRVLHRERVLQSVARLLGEKIELGPMGAGPGRRFARLRATGWFGEITGDELEGELLAYRLLLPISVDFELDLAGDTHRFRADVQIPLTLTVRTEAPITIVWDIAPPMEDEVTIDVQTAKRRSAVLQRITGLDAELRRFLMRVVQIELDKPHVRRATRLDMLTVIDGAWPVIADQFLPPLTPPQPPRHRLVSR